MSPLHNTPPERIAALHSIRDRHSGHTGATQRARLRDALETPGSVTTFEAMRYLDISTRARESWSWCATAWTSSRYAVAMQRRAASATASASMSCARVS